MYRFDNKSCNVSLFVKLKIHFYKFPHACTGNSGLYLYMCSDKKEGAGAIS